MLYGKKKAVKGDLRFRRLPSPHEENFPDAGPGPAIHRPDGIGCDVIAPWPLNIAVSDDARLFGMLPDGHLFLARKHAPLPRRPDKTVRGWRRRRAGGRVCGGC